jgi:hypothetical protein
MNNILINRSNSCGGAKETLIKVDKFSTNFIYSGSENSGATLESRNEVFPVFVTHQSMKKACVSITVLQKIALELLRKESFLSRFEIKETNL